MDPADSLEVNDHKENRIKNERTRSRRKKDGRIVILGTRRRIKKCRKTIQSSIKIISLYLNE